MLVSSVVVTLPISSAVDAPSPTRLITLTGPLAPVPGVSVSAFPKVTPPVASSITTSPSSVSAAALPMSSLKKTCAIPASIIRSLPSVACELIGVSFVKVTFAPPVAADAVSSVSIRRSVLSVTAPLNRTVSDVVSIVVPVATPSNVIPLAPMVVALPMSIEPSAITEVTPSLFPNVTPTAEVTVRDPSVRSSAPAPSDAPMSPSETTSPVAAVRTRLLCSST